MKAFNIYLYETFKKVFVPSQVRPENTEASFKEAMAKMHLTEESLIARRKALYRLCLLMTVLGFALLAYAVYHLIEGNYSAAVVSFVVSMIGFVLAFRYHFWYFQIKERKLGCTLREWYQQGFLGKKHEKTDI
jgi:intracellular multiplication protein IcmV